MTLAVAAAFEAAFQRKPTQEEVDRLARVMNVLDVRENDAIMVLMIVLEHYQGLYSAMPERIEDAAKTAVQETKEAARLVAATAAELAHSDLVEQLGNAVTKVASDTARAERWKALAIGIGVATITILVTGWLSFSTGQEAGVTAGYRIARHEDAAASWANTPEGQLAYKLALVGSLRQVARCSQPGWKVSKGACLPFSAEDGTLHGWMIP